MAAVDFTDFYILYKDHPRYVPKELIEDEVVNVIIQKYEMILFTNKGEVLGDPNFGANLLELLYETRVSSEAVRSVLEDQISTYIPELYDSSYSLDVVFTQDTENYQDIMFIYLNFADYDVYAQIGFFS
jgi:phage baseplate assembly protein W